MAPYRNGLHPGAKAEVCPALLVSSPQIQYNGAAIESARA